jgi:DNA-directed RNA polymerase subunit F
MMRIIISTYVIERAKILRLIYKFKTIRSVRENNIQLTQLQEQLDYLTEFATLVEEIANAVGEDILDFLNKSLERVETKFGLKSLE